MKTKLFLLMGVCAAMLTSCDQDIVNEIYLPGGTGSVTVTDSTKTGYLSINTSIAPSESTTRAATRAVNDQWENGDAIGVYANYASGSSWFSNGKFARKDNTQQFVSANTYYYQDQEACTLKAYYPYNAAATASNPSVAFACSAMATAQGQKATDFMYATGTARWAATPNLVFQHKMTRVVFNIIAGDGFTGTLNGGKVSTELLNADFTLYAIVNGTFNTQTGVVTAGTNYNTLMLSGPNNSTSGVAHCLSFEMILPPQSTENIEFQLVTDTDISLTSVIGNESAYSKWEAGYTYTYNVACNKESLSILSTSINPWVSKDKETITPTE